MFSYGPLFDPDFFIPTCSFIRSAIRPVLAIPSFIHAFVLPFVHASLLSRYYSSVQPSDRPFVLSFSFSLVPYIILRFWPSLFIFHIFCCVIFFIASVPDPPKIIRSEEIEYKKNVGDDVKLRCRATGASDDSNNRTLFFWKNQFGLVRQDRSKWPRYEIKQNSYLKITNIRAEDAGVYTCTATNEFGSSNAERRLRVFKNGKEIQPKKPPKNHKPCKLMHF